MSTGSTHRALPICSINFSRQLMLPEMRASFPVPGRSDMSRRIIRKPSSRRWIGGLLNAVPLYQINENATLSQDGTLDEQSRVAQEIRRQYCVPVFLKTFGTDVAYTNDRDGAKENVYVSADMTSQMAEMPNISGAAWSINEARYHPTIFVQGSPVPQKPLLFGYCPGAMN